MSQFKDIKDSKDFLPLHAKRTAILTSLSSIKVTLEKSKENPTLVSFERNEAKLNSKLEQLETASEAVSEYFCSLGGDHINDSDFISYLNEETTLTGELELVCSSYHGLLKSHGHFPPLLPLPHLMIW